MPEPACAAKPYAWAVEYAGRVALFLERARAEQAARDLHGVLVPLVRAEPSHTAHPAEVPR